MLRCINIAQNFSCRKHRVAQRAAPQGDEPRVLFCACPGGARIVIGAAESSSVCVEYSVSSPACASAPLASLLAAWQAYSPSYPPRILRRRPAGRAAGCAASMRVRRQGRRGASGAEIGAMGPMCQNHFPASMMSASSGRRFLIIGSPAACPDRMLKPPRKIIKSWASFCCGMCRAGMAGGMPACVPRRAASAEASAAACHHVASARRNPIYHQRSSPPSCGPIFRRR